MKKMKKTIEFGKINFCGMRKDNAVTVDIELKKNNNNDYVLSICGNIWNSKRTDIICGGQCLNDLLPYFKNNKLFNDIYYYWINYHLNDLHAGTPEQEKAAQLYLKSRNLNGIANNYGLVVDHLKKIGLYEVIVNGSPYKFGCGWLTEKIPDDVIIKIINIIES